MDNHEVNRTPKAQKNIHDKSSTALPFARRQDGPVCVQNHGQITHDTRQRAGKTKGSSEHEFDLDVAKDQAMPPAHEIVGRPDKCVDKVEGVR